MMKFLLFLVLLAALFFLAKRAMAGKRAMPRADAARLLGIAPDADAETIVDAHRRLIAKVHPDTGGSSGLAQQINEARDVMLRD